MAQVYLSCQLKLNCGELAAFEVEPYRAVRHCCRTSSPQPSYAKAADNPANAYIEKGVGFGLQRPGWPCEAAMSGPARMSSGPLEASATHVVHAYETLTAHLSGRGKCPEPSFDNIYW